MNSDSLPIDLIVEIMWRLPQKSITRFHCLSKLWASILSSPYFSDLFMTRSLSKPRILFAIEKDDGVWSFFSSHQRHSKSSSSLVVAAEFHMKFPPENMKIYSLCDRRFACSYASGLIYFYGMCMKKEDYDGVPVICNPNTGQYVALPYLLRYRKSYSFFGFDPIDKQFKVLFMAYPGCDDNKIMTLGTRKMRWRTIKCPLPNFALTEGICINGVLYYLGNCKSYVKVDVADDETSDYDYVIVCFDVRSEKFKFIYVESFCTLLNYKGKLCAVYWDDEDVYWKDDVNAAFDFELHLWVLEDAEKQEWSNYAYTLWDDKFFFVNDAYTHLDVVGVTDMGEIILSMGEYICNQPFYVFYFNPEKNTLQHVEIQGFGDYCHEALTKKSDHHNPFSKRHTVYTFANHVEDLKVNDTIKHLCFIREENKKMKKMKKMKMRMMKKKKDKMKNKKGKDKIGVR